MVDPSSSSDDDSSTEEVAQVRVKFQLASSIADRSLEVPKEPIAVPADIGRKGLSTVINHLLGRRITSTSKNEEKDEDDDSDDEMDDDDEGKEPPIQFEFILRTDIDERNTDEENKDGTTTKAATSTSSSSSHRLLRKGVEREARQYGVSLEEAIRIIYFPAANPPQLSNNEQEEKLPDWISTISYPKQLQQSQSQVTNDKKKSTKTKSSTSTVLCSGCYDGSIQVYEVTTDNDNDNTPQNKTATTSSSPAALKSLASSFVAKSPIKAMDTIWDINNSTVRKGRQTSNEKLWIASSSLDHTLTIDTYCNNDDDNDNDNDDSRSLQTYAQCMVPPDIRSSVISSLDFCVSSSSSFSLSSQQESGGGGDEGKNEHSSKSLLLASGDANGMICLWDIGNGNIDSKNDDDNDDQNIDDAEPSKKRKTSKASSKKTQQHVVKKISPKNYIVSAHSQLISGISWGNHHRRRHHNQFVDGSTELLADGTTSSSSNNRHLISGSWDHSIKLWDVEKMDCLLTLNGSRVVSCLDTSYYSEGIVATGHPDCTIRLWDVRVKSSSSNDNNNNDGGGVGSIVSDRSFRPSHKGWISSVKWSPINPYHLASTSHDGCFKLWDLRSSTPLYTVRALPKEEKGLCLTWAAESTSDTSSSSSVPLIFLGGTDCKIKHVQV